MTPILRVRDLAVEFPSEAGTVEAVRGVSFDVQPGETLAIVGESGSGKSVTALATMGLLPDTASVTGSVALAGRELLGRDDKAMSRIRGREIAMVFQDPMSSLTPVFTVGAQIVEALRIHQELTRAQATRQAVELLDSVNIADPERIARSFPHELSGGMRQRVMIAMAIANDPAVLIADEPTTALDVTTAAAVLELLGAAQRRTGAALLMITHDLGVVAAVADRVAVMYGGRIVEQAGVDDLFAAPRMPYTVGLLGAVPTIADGPTSPARRLVPIEGTPPLLIDVPAQCQFVPRCPIALPQCRDGEPALVEVGTDHLAACRRAGEIEGPGLIEDRPIFDTDRRPAAPQSDADRTHAPVLSVRGMRKTFAITQGLLKRRVGTVHAVDGVDFDVHGGQTLAIVGESGSGKSTTLTELMAFETAPGVVTLCGADPADLRGRARRRLRRRIAMVFQDPAQALDPRFTAYDVIAEPLRAQGLSKDETAARVGAVMAQVGLDAAHADRFPTAFSGGQRQRIAIARALVVRPDLVVLDEPLSALDVSVQAGIVNLLADVQAATGVALLLVAHDLAVVAQVADRIAVMYRGRFVETGTRTQLFAEPLHPYTRALLSAVPVPDPRATRTTRRVVLADAADEDQTGAQTGTACALVPRCPLYRMLPDESAARCRAERPALIDFGGDHRAACHFVRHPSAARLEQLSQEVAR